MLLTKWTLKALVSSKPLVKKLIKNNAIGARVFGVIVGLKEGQFAKVTALKFKKELEERGKEVQLLALTDITSDRLKNFTGIDAFIQVACPRISTDNEFEIGRASCRERV